jgi:membrane protein required for colicin V production
MNLLDIVILVPVGYVTYRGFAKGFVQEVFNIAGVILAIFITFKYMGPVAGFMAPFVENRDVATITAGIALFVMSLILVQAGVMWIERVLDIINLSILNKLAGMIFGFAKSAILVSAVLLLLTGINLPSEENREQSVTYPYIIQAAPLAYNFIARLYPEADGFIETIERNMQENNPLRELPIFDKQDE